MGKMKRLFGLSLVVLMTVLVSASAFAAKAVYVPTSGVYYSWNEKKNSWVKDGSFKDTFDKQGRLTKGLYKDTSGYTYGGTYKWKGNYIVNYNMIYYSNVKSSIKYVYKNNLVIKGGDSIYKWKGKTAKVTSKYDKRTIKVDNKKRIIYEKSDEGTKKYEYYTNGNIKRISTGNYTEKYNKNGYMTYSGYSDSNSCYKYIMDKSKNRPKSVIVTRKYNNKVTKSKLVYTSYAKVSRSRNCDAFGHEVALGR